MFTGSGFAPNETVLIFKQGVGSSVLAKAMTDAGGSFSATAAVAPQSPNGSRSFIGVGQASGALGAASYSVSTSLVLTPSQGGVGTNLAVQGYGFDPGETVNIYWGAPLTLLGSATANSKGSFVASGFTVPAGTTPGVHEVEAKNTSVGKPDGLASFTVQ